MADRFPSLDDFDAGQVEPRGNGTLDLDGPGGESSFLDRERAALGADADQFGPTQPAVTVDDGDDDLLGGGDYQDHHAAAEPVEEFESSFPAIDTQNEQVAPGGTITGVSTFPSSYSGYQEPEEESEPVRQWREKRDAEVARRDQISAEKKEASEKQAREDIDSFYESYNKRTDKQKAQTQKEAEEFLASREDTAAGGTSWERIAKLADLSGKGAKGGAQGSVKARMRELLLDLKKDPTAPGASGV